MRLLRHFLLCFRPRSLTLLVLLSIYVLPHPASSFRTTSEASARAAANIQFQSRDREALASSSSHSASGARTRAHRTVATSARALTRGTYNFEVNADAFDAAFRAGTAGGHLLGVAALGVGPTSGPPPSLSRGALVVNSPLPYPRRLHHAHRFRAATTGLSSTTARSRHRRTGHRGKKMKKPVFIVPAEAFGVSPNQNLDPFVNEGKIRSKAELDETYLRIQQNYLAKKKAQFPVRGTYLGFLQTREDSSRKSEIENDGDVRETDVHVQKAALQRAHEGRSLLRARARHQNQVSMIDGHDSTFSTSAHAAEMRFRAGNQGDDKDGPVEDQEAKLREKLEKKIEKQREKDEKAAEKKKVQDWVYFLGPREGVSYYTNVDPFAPSLKPKDIRADLLSRRKWELWHPLPIQPQPVPPELDGPM